MSVATAIRPGTLLEGTFWACPNCGTKLAEIVGRRAVIRYERRVWSMALDADPQQTCGKCGETSRAPEAT